MLLLRVSAALILIALPHNLAYRGLAQSDRKQTPGEGPNGVPQATFTSHRLGTDHAEGITSMDMNGDGFPTWSAAPTGTKTLARVAANGSSISSAKPASSASSSPTAASGSSTSTTTALPTSLPPAGCSTASGGMRIPASPPRPARCGKPHFITDSFDTEGGVFADINGDGIPDLALAHYNHSGVLWVDFSGPTPKVHRIGGKEQDGHGIGVADVDGDGSPDILTPTGWFKNVDANHDQWEWHADWNLGDAGFPILGYDVNGDGRTDVIFGQGHSYGLYWLEQVDSGEDRHWVRHTIDESFSQSHALALADIDGDGELELITGKRYRGHNGNDPGSYDPLVIYYYKIDRSPTTRQNRFTRYPISVNGTAGAGTQFVVLDLDKDGDIDIASAGKTGVHFFENLMIDRVPKEQREKELLLNKDWPFPAKATSSAGKRSQTPVTGFGRKLTYNHLH
jgi:hypothetical protein